MTPISHSYVTSCIQSVTILTLRLSKYHCTKSKLRTVYKLLTCWGGWYGGWFGAGGYLCWSHWPWGGCPGAGGPPGRAGTWFHCWGLGPPTPGPWAPNCPLYWLLLLLDHPPKKNICLFKIKEINLINRIKHYFQFLLNEQKVLYKHLNTIIIHKLTL